MIAKNKSKFMKHTYLFLTKQHQNIIIIKIILLAKTKSYLFFILRWFINIGVYIYDHQQKIRCQNCEIWPKYILQMFLTLIQLNG